MKKAPPKSDTAFQNRLNAALGHHQAGRLAEAGALYGELLGEAPGHAHLLNLAGVLNGQQGNIAQARTLLEAAAAADPNNPDIRFNLAQAMEMSGDADGAARAYQRALGDAPGHMPSLLNLGNMLMRADRASDAVTLFRRAVQTDARSAEAWSWLGLANQKLGRVDDGIAAFRKAATLKPDDAFAHANLGGLLTRQGDIEAAIEQIQKAVALRPDIADFHGNLGVALFAAGKAAKAVGEYDEALRLDTFNSRAVASKIVALMEIGEVAAARRLFDYDRLLVTRRLDAVAGYDRLDDFNRALADQVLANPTLMDSRPGKTTIAGKQTGDLLHPATGAIAVLEGQIRAAVSDYFAAARTPDHPFPHPVPTNWWLTAWATVLGSSGHQDAHNHPDGVLSGVYYVALPDVMRAGEGGDAGHIEFGRPNREFTITYEPETRTLKPEEGLMVLFPSSQWHRTIPYESDEPRISIAFDVLPRR